MQLKEDELIALSEFINRLRRIEKFGNIWTLLQSCGYDLYKNQTGYDSSIPSILATIDQKVKQDITRILFNYYTGMGNLCNIQDIVPYLRVVAYNAEKANLCPFSDGVLFNLTTKVLETFSSLNMAIDGSMYPNIQFIVPNNETYISNKIGLDGSYMQTSSLLLLNVDDAIIQKQFKGKARSSDIARQIVSSILGDNLLDANVQVLDGLYVEANLKLQ